MSEEPPFPLEPVEPSAGSLSRSLRRETYTYAYVYKQKTIENLNYIVHFRVHKDIYYIYHSLDRENKKILRRVIEEVIKSFVNEKKNKKIDFSVNVANINISISSPIQIVQQIVEKNGARELKMKLKKAEDALMCVSSVVQMYSRYCDARCVESIKRCIDSYRRG